MRWRLILEEFVPNIQHIAGKDNIVANKLCRLLSVNNEQNDHVTKGQVCANECFAFQKNTIYDGFPLQLPTVQEEKMEEEDKQAVVTLLRAYKSKYKDNIPNLLNKDALNRTQPELYRRLKSLISKPEDR